MCIKFNINHSHTYSTCSGNTSNKYCVTYTLKFEQFDTILKEFEQFLKQFEQFLKQFEQFGAILFTQDMIHDIYKLHWNIIHK